MGNAEDGSRDVNPQNQPLGTRIAKDSRRIAATERDIDDLQNIDDIANAVAIEIGGVHGACWVCIRDIRLPAKCDIRDVDDIEQIN